MSWCDKLASTPTVGIRCRPHYVPGTALLGAFTPLLDTWMDGDRRLFAIERMDQFTLALGTDSGFKYFVDQTRLGVEFQHQVKLKPTSAGLPVTEIVSKALPFTQLLPIASERVVRAAEFLIHSGPRELERIGIVSTTIVSEDEAPPGVLRFLRYLSRPWSGAVHLSQFSLIAELETTSGWADRCVHQFTRQEGAEQLLTIKFDWQRRFATAKPLVPASLGSLLQLAEVEALKYFEDLAEGNRFDADLISTAK